MGLSSGTPGLLVVVEGIDGAGKSTLARGLATRLARPGLGVVLTREPTDGPFGRRIRALAASKRDRIPPDEEWRLFHEDRRIHVEEVVRPALANGHLVIQDRSWPSTVAYQGERGLDRAMLRAAERRISPDPDLLLVLDLPAEEALERIRTHRGEVDAFEALDSLRRIRDVFLGFEGAVVLDGRASPDAVLDEAVARVEGALASRAGS